MHYIFNVLLLFIVSTSCSPTTPKALGTTKEIPSDKPTITTFILSFAESNKSMKIELYKTIKAKGYLKKRINIQKLSGQNIQLEAFGANDQLIASDIIKNPLTKKLEYSTDEGILKSKTIQLKKEYISFRTQSPTPIKYILISSLVNNQKTLLTKLTL